MTRRTFHVNDSGAQGGVDIEKSCRRGPPFPSGAAAWTVSLLESRASPGGFMHRRGIALLFALMIVAPLLAQRGRGGAPAESKPAPRWPDGHVNLSPLAGEAGLWVGNGGRLVVNPNSYEPNATRNAPIHIDDAPLQDWARALTNFRHRNVLADEPHTR